MKSSDTAWLPISTAPKDGTKILVWKHHTKTEHLGNLRFKTTEWDTIAVAWWYVLTREKEVKAGKGLYKKVEVKEQEGWSAGWGWHFGPNWVEPTHWTPIPPLPKIKKDKA